MRSNVDGFGGSKPLIEAGKRLEADRRDANRKMVCVGIAVDF